MIENLKGQSLDIGLGNNFWMGHRKQAKKAGLHQTKKLCTALKKNEEAPMKQDKVFIKYQLRGQYSK